MRRFVNRPATRRGILLLALAAVASFLATRDLRQDLGPGQGEVDTRLNYALFDFEALLLDKQGELAMTIQAPELQNNASSGVGTVSTPNIFLREAGNDWRIVADSAVVSADREFVSLAGAVSVVRYNAQTSDRLEIDTRDLLLAVSPRTATTDAHVNMRHAGDRLEANGMQLDLVKDRYQLFADVSAHYDMP